MITSKEDIHVLLLVEDDADMRMMIRHTLSLDERLDLSVGSENAEDALGLCQEMHPALIILDHKLPGELDGLEVAPQLKERCPDTKILLFSAYELADAVDAEPSVDAFVSKMNISALLPTVRRLLDMEPLESK